METETIKITDLKPARYNPRKISPDEYQRLSRSIKEYGFVDPIIINLQNMHIIGGHQRYDILMDEYLNNNEDYQELTIIKNGDIGWAFPAGQELEVKDLNYEKGLNIALNNQKLMGSWDNSKLEDLFNDLVTEGFDYTLTGFEKDEIKDVFKDIDLNMEDPLASDDPVKVPENETKPANKLHVCPDCGCEFYD